MLTGYSNGRGHHILIFIPLLLLLMIFISYDSDFLNRIIIINGQENGKLENYHQIIIPKGSANPSVDITKLEERQWYVPPKLKINSGDTVTWINNDVESHTVTSGVGTGIMSLLTNEMGSSNGIFDSGLFGPSQSWSFTFSDKKGIFDYFCTIHPWMIGSVEVGQSPIKREKTFNYTDYPVDSQGNKLSRFPVHTFTNDGKYDIDMGWSPLVLETHSPSTFLIDFFEMPSNKKSHLLPFDVVIIQNNKTLAQTSGLSQVGSATFQFTFSEPGPVTIKIINVGDNQSYSIFDTLVYQNPNMTSMFDSQDHLMQHDSIISPLGRSGTGLISPIFLVQLTYAIIFSLPAALGIIILLYKKKII